MCIEDELVNDAFELLGEFLVTKENAKEETAKRMLEKTGLDDSIVNEIVNIAFERWMEVYDQ